MVVKPLKCSVFGREAFCYLSIKGMGNMDITALPWRQLKSSTATTPSRVQRREEERGGVGVGVGEGERGNIHSLVQVSVCQSSCWILQYFLSGGMPLTKG